MPSGTGGVNGIVKYTMVDSPGVPTLTSVSLLTQVGAVNTMDLKNIETTLRVLPSGHVAHKLTEFAPGGWEVPTPEQTELFQVNADEFLPVTLPGEFTPRPRKHCVRFSNGFVRTVHDRSHHQHVLDLCVDDTGSSDLFTNDQFSRKPPMFECSFASELVRKPGAGCRGSVAKTCCALPCSRHPSIVAGRAGLVTTNLLKKRSDRVHSFAGIPGPSGQPVDLDGCVRQKTWGIWRHHEPLPLSRGNRPQRGNDQDEREEERYYHDLSKSHSDCRGCLYQRGRGRCLSEMRPRTSRLQHRIRTDSTLPWMEPRRNTLYIDQSVPRRSRLP